MLLLNKSSKEVNNMAINTPKQTSHLKREILVRLIRS